MPLTADRGAALITGAGRRIGRVLALRAASAGFDVAIHHHHSQADATGVADEVRALGRSALVISADLAEADRLSGLIDQARAGLGALTLLVNCASLFQDDSLHSLTADSFDAHLTVNLRAPVLLSQAFGAALPDGREGLIVNIIDQRVLKPDPGFFSYGLSKAGLLYATRTLAQALAPRIRVNAIGPGPTLASIHQTPEDFAAEAAGVLLERPVAPEEIADALAYLIDARSVTGQMITVDSGKHLTWKTSP
jgi:NAD(P)-dependent dehydrogenase (short-subunit alcohol dehydrogenase family)